MNKKVAIVLGAGGFIGGHLVKRLVNDGYWVRGVDRKKNEYQNFADEFIVGDLTDPRVVESVIMPNADEVYQLAAEMGGALFVFTGLNDAEIMHHSAMINLNVAAECLKKKVKKVFYSSSACIYPEYNQRDAQHPVCTEASAYPAAPDSNYGWEKLFSERVYQAFHENHKLNVRIARFHNIFGTCGEWKGGREKAPAAMCRKVAETPDGGTIEVWGDGQQTRSFLYVDTLVEGVRRFMEQDGFIGPVNIGSTEMVTINQLAQMTIDIAGKDIQIKNLIGEEFQAKYGYKCPIGILGRNSDNTLIKEKLGWEPVHPLKDGLAQTYPWIRQQVALAR
jgi:nucleoside-diphosphate-sugar epimerase